MTDDSTPGAYRRFLRTRDAAAFVGMSARTLEALRLNGGGPTFCRPPGRRLVVYDRLDLEAWAKSGRRRTTSDAVSGDEPRAAVAAAAARDDSRDDRIA